jgi:hypothetical protein
MHDFLFRSSMQLEGQVMAAYEVVHVDISAGRRQGREERLLDIGLVYSTLTLLMVYQYIAGYRV